MLRPSSREHATALERAEELFLLVRLYPGGLIYKAELEVRDWGLWAEDGRQAHRSVGRGCIFGALLMR